MDRLGGHPDSSCATHVPPKGHKWNFHFSVVEGERHAIKRAILPHPSSKRPPSRWSPSGLQVQIEPPEAFGLKIIDLDP